MAIGVEVTTSLRSGPSNPGVQSGRFQVAGITERGAVDQSRLVTSIAGYESEFGGRTPYSSAMFDTARLFFEEGGSELIVSRAVGPNASPSSLALMDSAGVPVATLTVEALSPGAYGTGLEVEVLAGTANTYGLNIYSGGVLVNQYRDLATPGDAVTATQSSRYVRVLDEGSPTAAPGNNPAPIGRTALVGGDDDRAAVTTADVLASLDRPGPETRGAAVAAPGYPASVIGDDLISHARDTAKLALLAPAAGATVDDAIADADGLVGTLGDYGALFFPHVVIQDGSSTRSVSPEGYIAGQRARKHQAVGFWASPAGEFSRSRFVQSTVIPIDKVTNDRLNAAHVNGIVTLANSRPRIYGWSSLSDDVVNMGRLSDRDTLNNLTVLVGNVLEQFVFERPDAKGFLMAKVESAVEGVLAPIARAGGFYGKVGPDGELEDTGYRVIVDSTNNTLESLAQNELRVLASVRLAPVAELIRAEIVKVALQSAV